MELKKLNKDFSVCKVKDYSLVNLDAEYSFVGKTDEERSLVCITNDVPSNVIQRDDGWKGFRVQGVLDFSLVGILSEISDILSDNGISIFAISTYNTDYILIKRKTIKRHWMFSNIQDIRFQTDKLTIYRGTARNGGSPIFAFDSFPGRRYHKPCGRHAVKGYF